MTGSTHVDLEIDSNVDATTNGLELSTHATNDNALPSNIPPFVGPPKITNTKLTSRNILVATFSVPIKGIDACHRSSIGQRQQPRQLDKELDCCRKIFKEPPFLLPYGTLLYSIKIMFKHTDFSQ